MGQDCLACTQIVQLVPSTGAGTWEAREKQLEAAIRSVCDGRGYEEEATV